MKNSFYIILLALLLQSCKERQAVLKNEYFTAIEIDTLSTDSMSIRAIAIDKEKVWFGADKGRYGYVNLITKEKFQERIAKDSLDLEFRSIAQNGKSIFIFSIASPGLLYKVAKGNSSVELVYEERNDKTFYDSMQFWNEKEGIAIGDPTENCFSILITRDYGDSWQKISCEKLPKAEEGEGAFAASNTNLIVKGKNAWIVSGGKKARVFYSPDKGVTWEVFNTPIVQGSGMTGIFSADFYDENIGFIVGGNYEKPEENSGNKALTINGGKTWTLLSENQGFGYASCVQFVPNSGGKQLVTVGFSGLNYSSDNGNTWKQLSSNKDFHTIRFIDDSTAIAAGKNKIVRVRFKK